MKFLKEMLNSDNAEQATLVDKVKRLSQDLKNNKPTPIFVKWVELRDRILNGKRLESLRVSDLNYLVKRGNKLYEA